jgi:hypothetical protein
VLSRPHQTTKFLALCASAVRDGSLVKVTLSHYRGADATLRNVFVRPIVLGAGPRLSFVYRHTTRDITKNFTHEVGLSRIETLLGRDFRIANLFTTEQSAQLEVQDGRKPRLTLGKSEHRSPPATGHDRPKKRFIDPKGCAWLQTLGVTKPDGRVAKGMEDKFRQINRFVEVLEHLFNKDVAAALKRRHEHNLQPAHPGSHGITVIDMGCGKGYLTFAAYDWLNRKGWSQNTVRGVEARPDLVELCNRVARQNSCAGLSFEAGTIASTSLTQVDVLVALHACDTATDDAIGKGIQAGALLILVTPCCHQELRPQLRPPPVLAGALKHGILLERQAEFVTDALRAALLEWAGYDTKVFEFVSTEHTAKNLMIAAVKRERGAGRDELGWRVQELAAFYGIKAQRLAGQLGFELEKPQRGLAATKWLL